MELTEEQLRSALKELVPPVEQSGVLQSLMSKGRAVRRRHQLFRAAEVVGVLAIVAVGVLGVSWLVRDLPSDTAVTSSSGELIALPALTPGDVAWIQVYAAGGNWSISLDPTRNAEEIDSILAAYRVVRSSLSSTESDGPVALPDVTMVLAPKSGDPLFIGMYAVMSSIRLRVWTAPDIYTGSRLGARASWISGEALHALFRNYFGLALEASSSTGSSNTTTSESSVVPSTTAPTAADLDHVAALLAAAGIDGVSVSYYAFEPVAGAPMFYDVSWPKPDASESMLRDDRARRALAWAKQQGELSLAYVGFRSNESAPGAAGGGLIQQYDASSLTADPSSSLTENRAVLLPRVTTLVAECGVDLTSASVDVDQKTQLLSVTVSVPSGTDAAKLAVLGNGIRQLVDNFNKSGGNVGVSFLCATDPSGAFLGATLNDSVCGATSWSGVFEPDS